MKLTTLLLKTSNIHRIPLTGLWQGMFYHIVFVPNGNKYTSYILFDNGNSIELKADKKLGYTSFEDMDRHVIINTGEPLWFSDGVVNAPKAPALVSVTKQSKIEANKLYQSIRTILEEYYDFYHPEELNLVCAHIIHTYILGLLGKTFYLLLEGEKNTGKSSLQGVMAQLQFNGCFSGKVTMASLIRKIHFFAATINIDELDKLHKDEKQVAIGILNSGVYSTGTYEIVNMDSKKSSGQIKIFNTFGSKTFSANRALFDDSLLSRCVVINTVRNTRPVKSIHGTSEEEMKRFQYLRNQLFAYCLMNGKAIYSDILASQKEVEEGGRYGRRCDIFSVVAGVLKHFGAPYSSTLEYLEGREPLNDEGIEDSRYYITLNFLIEKCGYQAPPLIEFTNHELWNHLMKELDMDEGERFSPTPRSIGSLLKKHRIVDKDSERQRITSGSEKGRYAYRIDTVKILELIERSQFDDLKKKIRELDFPSPK